MKQFFLIFILIQIQIKHFLFGHKKMSLFSGPELILQRFHGKIHFCKWYKKPKERYPGYHIYQTIRCRFWEKTTLYIPEDYQTVVYIEGRSLWQWNTLRRPEPKKDILITPGIEFGEQYEAQTA